MRIVKKTNTCWLEEMPIGSTCEVPSLQQNTIFLVVHDEEDDFNPVVLVDLDSGNIYRKLELGNFEDVVVVPVQCSVEQWIENE